MYVVAQFHLEKIGSNMHALEQVEPSENSHANLGELNPTWNHIY